MTAAILSLRQALERFEGVIERSRLTEKTSKTLSSSSVYQTSDKRTHSVVSPTPSRNYEWEDDIVFEWPIEIDGAGSEVVITPIYLVDPDLTTSHAHDNPWAGVKDCSIYKNPTSKNAEVRLSFEDVVDNPKTPYAYDVWVENQLKGNQLKGTTTKITDAIELGLSVVAAAKP